MESEQSQQKLTLQELVAESRKISQEEYWLRQKSTRLGGHGPEHLRYEGLSGLSRLEKILDVANYRRQVVLPTLGHLQKRREKLIGEFVGDLQERVILGELTPGELEMALADLEILKEPYSEEAVKPAEPQGVVKPEVEVSTEKREKEPIILPGEKELTDLTDSERRGIEALLKGKEERPISSDEVISEVFSKELEEGIPFDTLRGRWSTLRSRIRWKLREAEVEVVNTVPRSAGSKGMKAAYYLRELEEPHIQETAFAEGGEKREEEKGFPVDSEIS